MIFKIATVLMYILFRPKIHYVNNWTNTTKLEKPAILIANHTNCIDGALMAILFRKSNVYTIAAKDWYDKPILHSLLKKNKCIPIDRYNPDTKWLHKSKQVIKEGGCICIFPEGRTSKSGEFLKFKSGFLMLALTMEVPVIPVCLIGKYYPFFGRRKQVIINEPVYLKRPQKRITKEYMDEESEKLWKIMKETLDKK